MFVRNALLWFVLLGVGSADAGERTWYRPTVFQSFDAAVSEVFAGADSVWSETWTPTTEERTALDERLGEHVSESSFTFHRGRLGSHDMGWALVLDEIGLHEPITHLVKIDDDGTIADVRILVFRETRGDAIKRPRFLQQFRGKTGRDRLTVGRDIDAVTGATYSSKAITRGVRKALALVAARYENRRDR